MKFKVGDKVRITDSGQSYTTHIVAAKEMGLKYFQQKESRMLQEGEEAIIVGISDRIVGIRKNNQDYLIGEEGIELIKKGGPMANIKTLAKKLLEPDTRTLIEAGYVSENLELTDKATEAIQTLQFMEYKEDLVKMAKADLKAEK